tara:strand:+ start:1681 stop:3612 length:1932 start_codon:yes stop_codon:yes gene_type:complete
VAKITRKKLSRGTKLTPEHVYPPLASAASQLTGIAIEKEQMQAPMAPFRVNLTLPYLASDSLPKGHITMPFVLPPPQDLFLTANNAAGGKDAIYSGNLPQMKLKSVSFSFDQRGEPGAIASQFWKLASSGTANTGKYGYSSEQGHVSYEDVTRLDIALSLHEKTQEYFGDTYPYNLERELWSTTIPAAEGYAGVSLRANPFIQTDMDIAVDPYKTLVLSIQCPGLEDSNGRNLALPSIEVSMKFACELMPRDTGQTTVQNIPADGGSGTGKYGAKTAPSVTINTPTHSTAIESDSSDGVTYNIDTLDEQFRDKLEGGYNRFADVPPTEVIADDAAYEVIAVPLYQNMAHGGLSASPAFYATYPYLATLGGTGNTTVTEATDIGAFDRRIIPIHHSYTIQHAILAWNWTPWELLNWDGDGGTKPISSGSSSASDQQRANIACPSREVTLDVGVGIGTGASADNFDYEQVAKLSISNPNNYGTWDGSSGTKVPTDPTTKGTWDTSLIDRITSTVDPPRVLIWDSGGTAALGVPKWNWELHSIPIVGSGTFGAGVGYYTQGKEVFVGPGWTRTSSRTNMQSSAPDTGGAEQWIEVRANLYPTTSIALNAAPYQFDPASTHISDKSSILIGYGGCYVYLICKKHLTK